MSIIVNTDLDSAIENIDTFENSLDATTTFQAAHYFNSVKAPAGGVNATAEFQISARSLNSANVPMCPRLKHFRTESAR